MRLVATLHRTIARIQASGQTVFRETHFYDYGKEGTEYDTLDVRAADLRLVRLVEVQGPDRNKLEFDGKRLIGFVSKTGVQQPVNLTVGPFFHDMMDDSFTAMYPFDSLTSFVVDEIRPPDLTIRTVRFQTQGRATLQSVSGPVDCITVARENDITMWVSAKDGHLVRLRWERPNGVTAWRLPLRDTAFIGS